MSTLVITGNGFDIAHGIPTKYCDFRNFVIKKYPNALKYRDEITLIEDVVNIDYEEFAAEILLSTMDKIAGDDWYNFEEALASVNFDHKFPTLIEEAKKETEEVYGEIMGSYMRYLSVLSSAYIECSKYWQELFRLWIKDVQKTIETNKYLSKKSLKDLFSIPNTMFFTFNYTKTLQCLYGVKKVIHIHNRSGQKLIFGHGQNNVAYANWDRDIILGSFSLDDMLMSFKKDTVSPFKKYNDFFKKLDDSIDKVYSYGFSYGKVDSIYIKEIIRRISPNATWYFTSFEVKDKEAIRVKKIKLRRYGFQGTFGEYEG